MYMYRRRGGEGGGEKLYLHSLFASRQQALCVQSSKSWPHLSQQGRERAVYRQSTVVG